MRTLIVKNGRKVVLVFSIVLSALILTASTGDACNGVDVDIVGHVEHIADDLCAIGSSIRLISFAVIGIFLALLAQVILAVFKKN